mmetsp:Transcript_11264/g.35964  ORF Transcript_11264/g.35964 Transcript_11264/m.35964 type:complete len:499 (-) Transcript_11264:218-1714(-)
MLWPPMRPHRVRERFAQLLTQLLRQRLHADLPQRAKPVHRQRLVHAHRGAADGEGQSLRRGCALAERGGGGRVHARGCGGAESVHACPAMQHPLRHQPRLALRPRRSGGLGSLKQTAVQVAVRVRQEAGQRGEAHSAGAEPGSAGGASRRGHGRCVRGESISPHRHCNIRWIGRTSWGGVAGRRCHCCLRLRRRLSFHSRGSFSLGLGLHQTGQVGMHSTRERGQLCATRHGLERGRVGEHNRRRGGSGVHVAPWFASGARCRRQLAGTPEQRQHLERQRHRQRIVHRVDRCQRRTAHEPTCVRIHHHPQRPPRRSHLGLEVRVQAIFCISDGRKVTAFIAPPPCAEQRLVNRVHVLRRHHAQGGSVRPPRRLRRSVPRLCTARRMRPSPSSTRVVDARGPREEVNVEGAAHQHPTVGLRLGLSVGVGVARCGSVRQSDAVTSAFCLQEEVAADLAHTAVERTPKQQVRHRAGFRRRGGTHVAPLALRLRILVSQLDK